MSDWKIEIPLNDDYEMFYDVDENVPENFKFINISEYDKYYNHMDKVNVGVEIPHLMNWKEKQKYWKNKDREFGSTIKAKKNPLKWEQAKRRSESMKHIKSYKLFENL
jgi:hypothetical protein